MDGSAREIVLDIRALCPISHTPQGRVVQRWISANPALKSNPLF